MKRPLKKILTVSNDAGGAEMIAAYIKRFQKKYNFSIIISGPAEKVFLTKKVKVPRLDFVSGTDPKIILKKVKPDLVLTSTSWQTSTEKDFVVAAKVLQIKTAVYLDHWINYRERFGYPARDWKNNLPDEIWVGDSEALVMAKGFGFPKVKLVRNEYFVELKEKIKKLKPRPKNSEQKTILFISEPISIGAQKKFGNPRYWGFTEHDVLKDLCNLLVEIQSEQKTQWHLVIRKHPSDAPDSYDQIIKKFGPKINIVYSIIPDLVSEIAVSNIILGMDSVALVIGLLAKKKVISYIPSRKKRCSLPFKALIKVKKQANLRAYLGPHLGLVKKT